MQASHEIHSTLSHAITVRSFNANRAQSTKLEFAQKKWLMKDMAMVYTQSTLAAGVGLLNQVFLCGILWYSIGEVVGGHMELGQLISLTMLASKLIDSATDLLESYPKLMAFVGTMQQVLLRPHQLLTV